MKFKKLNEDINFDDVYKKLTNYIYDILVDSLDNLIIRANSDVDEYDADWSPEDMTRSYIDGTKYLRKAAELYAQWMMEEAPDVTGEDE